MATQINIQKYATVLEAFKSGELFYSDGRVWRRNKLNSHSKLVELSEPEIASHKTARGYRRLVHNKITVYEHTVIYALFNGVEKLKEIDCVDHLNANKEDNRIENLEGVSIAENNRRAESMGLVARTYGTINGMHKLTDREVRMVKELYRLGLTQYQIADLVEVSQGYISVLVNGKKRKFG